MCSDKISGLKSGGGGEVHIANPCNYLGIESVVHRTAESGGGNPNPQQKFLKPKLFRSLVYCKDLIQLKKFDSIISSN